MKLWDLARDHGAHGSRAIQAVIKVLPTPSFSDWKCQICNATVPKDSHYAVHVAESHLSMTIEEITDCLMLEEDKIEEIFSVGRRLLVVLSVVSCILYTFAFAHLSTFVLYL